jgi:hypothetical protein
MCCTQVCGPVATKCWQWTYCQAIRHAFVYAPGDGDLLGNRHHNVQLAQREALSQHSGVPHRIEGCQCGLRLTVRPPAISPKA